MKKNTYLHLGIETMCLVFIVVGLTQLKSHENISNAKSITVSLSPDTILKQATVQKLSGSVDGLDNVINDQLDAFFGENATELFQNMSMEDAIKSAKETAMGIYIPDQLKDDIASTISDFSKTQDKIAEANFFASVASLSAMNAKFMNDQTKELVDKMQKINDSLTKYNTLMKDIVKIEDSISSKLPKWAVK